MSTSTPLLLLLGLGLATSTASAQGFRLAPPASAQELVQHFTQPKSALPAPAQRGAAGTIFLPGRLVSYGRDEAVAAWVEPQQYSFVFDSQGRQTQETISDSTSGTPQNRRSTTYNAAGQITQDLTELYFSGAWQNGSRILTTYDAQQRKSGEEYQFYQPNDTWQTEDGAQYVNQYNAANQLTAQTIRGYRPSTGTYQDSLRYLYTLAASGEWTARVEQGFDNGTWINQERQQNVVWHNFAKGQMLSGETQEWTGSQWRTATRIIGTYTATTEEQVVQELLGSTWENAQRQFARYDAQGSLVEAKIELWDGSAWAVSFIEVQIQLFYNPDTSVRRRITSVAFLGQPLELVQLDNFSAYRTLVLGAKAPQAPRLAAHAYPNPSADGRFTISLPAPTSAAQVRVLDAVGRPVATDAWSGTARTSFDLNLSRQQAGLYTVSISTAAGTAVQKLVIQ